MLIALVTPPSSRKSLICSATCIATLTCASLVDAPRCGVEMKFGVPNSGEAVAGSISNTSSAAPATWPLSSASLSACSSISPPRAQLMIRTPGRQEGVERRNFHPESERAGGDDRADVAAADQAKRLAGHLDTHEAVLFPLALLGRGV